MNFSISIGKNEKKNATNLQELKGRFKLNGILEDNTEPGTYKVLTECEFPPFLNTFTWNERRIFHSP